jgi:WD40 repeat protein
VQIYDWAAKTEIRRFETPPGYRGSAEYALLTPDWKTLYVPVNRRTVRPIERDAKRLNRIEYAGEIRVWDVESGKEQAPLPCPEGSAPIHAALSPGAQLLLAFERPSYDAVPRVQAQDTTVVWDLASRQKRKLCDGFAVPAFSPDGKTLGAVVADDNARESLVKLLDLTTGEQLAVAQCPDKDRFLAIGEFSPDGSLLMVRLGGKLAAPTEVWFLDGKTLAERGKFLGDGDPKRYGWAYGGFSPDSRTYVILDSLGKAHLWDTKAAQVTRTCDIGSFTTQHAFSPDGSILAVGWMPPADTTIAPRNADPLDLPQARVTLFDLTGTKPPRVLIARRGYAGGLAFSPDGRTLAFGGAGAVHLFDLSK